MRNVTEYEEIEAELEFGDPGWHLHVGDTVYERETEPGGGVHWVELFEDKQNQLLHNKTENLLELIFRELREGYESGLVKKKTRFDVE